MPFDTAPKPAEAHRQNDQIHPAPGQSEKPLFSLDLLAKQEKPIATPGLVPDLTINHDEAHTAVRVPDGHGGTKLEGMGYVKDDLTRWNAETSPAAAESKRMGYKPDDLTKWNAGTRSDGAERVADAGQNPSQSNPSEIIINSGAGSRAQLFNRGPRIEQKVTVPNPAEVPPAAAPQPSENDAPKIVPYDGPGSRARLFRNQPADH